MLDGDRMAVSLYDIAFNVSVKQQPLCTLILSDEQVQKFQDAIEDLYYFEFVFGKLSRKRAHFDMMYMHTHC